MSRIGIGIRPGTIRRLATRLPARQETRAAKGSFYVISKPDEEKRLLRELQRRELEVKKLKDALWFLEEINQQLV